MNIFHRGAPCDPPTVDGIDFEPVDGGLYKGTAPALTDEQKARYRSCGFLFDEDLEQQPETPAVDADLLEMDEAALRDLAKKMGLSLNPRLGVPKVQAAITEARRKSEK